MTARHRSDSLEGTIEAALRPGWFISWRDGTGFAAGLDEAASGIEKLIAAHPTRAVALYEAFIAGCYEKAEEVDDSGGELGSFVERLFLAWIRARQAAGVNPEETVSALLAWMDSDQYGFCSGLERTAAKVLDRRGRGAFEREMHRRFEEAGSDKPGDDRNAEYVRHRWGAALKSLYAETRNVAAYVSLCEQTELTAADCQVLAEVLRARGKLTDALGWVERGLEIHKKGDRAGTTGGYKLPDMK